MLEGLFFRPITVPKLCCETSVPVEESVMASGTKHRAPFPPALPNAGAAVLIGCARVSSADGLDTARLMSDRLLTMEEIASRLGVGRTTLYRALGRSRAVAIAATSAKVSKARAPGRKPRAAAAATDGKV